jgi:hypothetical protein
MIRTFKIFLLYGLSLALLLAAPACDRYEGDFPDGLPQLPDGILGAGFGRADITPEIDERFFDFDEDGIFDGDVNYPEGNTETGQESFSDNNSNDHFDALWLALRHGVGGRPARGIRDELSVSSAIFKAGGVTVALAVLDLPGLQRHEIEKIRQRLGFAYAIDHLSIIATGNRQAPDTIGTAFPYPEASSYNEQYIEFIGEAVLASIDAAAADFGPVQMELAKFDSSSLGLIDGGPTSWGLCADTRDPIAYDPTFTIAAFYPMPVSEPSPLEQQIQSDQQQTVEPSVGVLPPETTGDEEDIAPFDGLPEARGSLLFWGCSPTTLPDSDYISADFPAKLRESIDYRLGGQSIFLPVATGGQSPAPVSIVDLYNGRYVIDDDGLPIATEDNSFVRLESIASSISESAIESLKHAEIALNISVGFISSSFPIPVDAPRYLSAVKSSGRQLFDAEGHSYSTGRVFVESEATLLTIGPLELLLLPGDPLPEFTQAVADDFEAVRSQYFLSSDQTHVTPYPEAVIFAGADTLAISNAGDALGLLAPEADYAAAATAPGHYNEASSPGPETLNWLLDGLNRMGLYPIK